MNKNSINSLSKRELKARIIMTDKTTAFRPNITKKQLLKIYKNL
jgi:hypothetical protein